MKRLLWIVLIFLVGCAPWTRVGGLYKSESHNFSVDLPQGWMRWSLGKNLLITRDGLSLQYILIERMKIEDSLKHTKKKFSKDMLPQEAAEVILDNIASDQAVLDFRLIENQPVRIGGFSGFRTVYTYKNQDGLKIKSVYCGFIADKWFYGVNYNAAQRYYFDKDIKTFEKVLDSFKLIKTV